MKLLIASRFSILFLGLTLLLSSCHRTGNDFSPKLRWEGPAEELSTLASPFSPLSEKEKASDWGRELYLGQVFAKRHDFYRAIGSFERCLILAPLSMRERRMECSYDVVLSYFLACHYCEALQFFQNSDLIHAGPSFPAYKDLLVILYGCYHETGDDERAGKVLDRLCQIAPATAAKLELGAYLSRGNLEKAKCFAQSNPEFQEWDEFVCQQKSCMKDPCTAQFLNGVVPGLGYAYLGQTQSAVTSFLLNGLFIWATYEFVDQELYAPAILAGGLEIGWYLGGIGGAGSQARFYNEQVYQRAACAPMVNQGLFPALQLQFTF